MRDANRSVTHDLSTGEALPAFFAGRPPDGIGMALFLNAGDPPLDALGDVVQMLDDCAVDCLELAIPFPDSFTDGPVIRRSARRAIELGVEACDVLAFLSSAHRGLKHLRIALLADWSFSLRATPLYEFLSAARVSGADAFMLLGLPPRLRPGYYAAAARANMPIVTSCYANSRPGVLAEAGAHASAYLYLVAHYGRTGTPPASGYSTLSGAIGSLRAMTGAPIAVGFGVSSRSDLEAIHRAGADAVVVGSAGVARVERALTEGRDASDELYALVEELRLHQPVSPAALLNGTSIHPTSDGKELVR